MSWVICRRTRKTQTSALLVTAREGTQIIVEYLEGREEKMGVKKRQKRGSDAEKERAIKEQGKKAVNKGAANQSLARQLHLLRVARAASAP